MNTEEQKQSDTLSGESAAAHTKVEFGWKLLALTLIACIIGGSLISAAFYYKQQQRVALPEDLTPQEKEMVWNPSWELVEADIPEEKYFGHESIDETEKDEKPNLWTLMREGSSVEEYDLAITWLDRPAQSEVEELPLRGPSRSYIVGTVTNGVFADQPVHLFYEAGMGEYPTGLFVLSPEVTEVTEWIDEVYNLPEEIVVADGAFTLRKDGQLYAALVDIESRSAWSSSTIGNMTLSGLENIPENQLYTYESCLFARTPSDLVVEYIIDIPFIVDQEEGSYKNPTISFTRVDGERVSGTFEIYNRVSYGCGSLCTPLKVVDRSDEEFVLTGTADDGTQLYVLKDIYDERYSEVYNQKNTRAYIDTSSGQYEALSENKYAYEEFLQIVPLLYWKDPLGRWVEFVNTEFIILAEKCKPVIYLYPEEETDLHVEVEPNIAFTKTIPEYEGGWDVTAYPDGTVIDRDTGDEYEYLYWAGLVDGYPLVEEGWVVAHGDLPAFFDHFLPLYGLQGKEITDFTEYWIEDMDEAPFYAVNFVEQAIIDELSPLTLDKEPDVVLRVLMSAMPLQRPIPIPAPELPVIPERTGFTVVEWGGTILRP